MVKRSLACSTKIYNYTVTEIILHYFSILIDKYFYNYSEIYSIRHFQKLRDI